MTTLAYQLDEDLAPLGINDGAHDYLKALKGVIASKGGASGAEHYEQASAFESINAQRDRVKELSPLVSTQMEGNFPFIAVQAWEGVVERISAEEIDARLFDKTRTDGPDSFVSIKRSELDQEDKDLIVPGAVFYWMIGYEERPSGRRRSSFIRFRRMPAWSQKQLDKIAAKSEQLLAKLRPIPM